MSNRSTGIQGLRAIAAILVLAFHLYAVEAKYFPYHVIPHVIGMLGTCGVDLFFVISGFVMVTTSSGRFSQRGAAMAFLSRRVLRIYPIYWFYSAIVLGVMLVMPQWVNSSAGHAPSVVASFTLLPSASLPLLMQAWTLTYEMFFYIVFACLLRWTVQKHLGRWLAAWAVITLAAAMTLRSTPGPFMTVVTDPMVLEFIAGCAIALVYRKVSRTPATAILALGMACYAVTFWLGSYQSQDEVLELRALYFGIPAAAVVMGIVALEVAWREFMPQMLCRIGDASYSIYLSHILVISAIGRVFARFPQSSAIVGSAACFVGAIACGFAAYRLVEVPINNAAKRLGFRSRLDMPA